MKENQRQQAFTLVELIVVITILAILGTIGFISLLGFQKTARDSARISDTNTIVRALEFFRTQEGYYPDPSNSFDVTFSGSLAWKQGTFGKDTQKLTRRISKVPVDPLTGNEYTYSTTNTRQEYELGAISEKYIGSTSDFVFPVSQSYAANNYYTNIVGNYNHQIVTVKESNRIYILGVPTIITREINSVSIQDILTNNSFAFHGSNTLPGSYNNALPGDQTIEGTMTFTPGTVIAATAPVLFEGSVESLSQETNRQQFADNLQSYYTNSNLEEKNLPGMDRLLSLSSDNSLDYVNTLIQSETAGLNEVDTSSFASEDSGSLVCPRVTQLLGNGYSRAALRSDNVLVTWGHDGYGGNTSSIRDQLVDVKKVVSKPARISYAVLKNDGSVMSWIGSDFSYASSVQSQLQDGVVDIVSLGLGYIAYKEDGSNVIWPENLAINIQSAGIDVSNIKEVQTNGYDYVIIKNDNTGFYFSNDFSSGFIAISDIKSVHFTEFSLVVLHNDGTVTAPEGAFVDSERYKSITSVQSQLHNVIQISTTNKSYAALKSDGTVVAWGSHHAYGADREISDGGDSSPVQSQLQNVTKIYSNTYAHAALKSDNTVVTWGRQDRGGDSSTLPGGLNGISEIIYNGSSAFAARKIDGSIVTWGHPSFGGDSSSVQLHLQSGVKEVLSNGAASVALKNDGTLVAWGYPNSGGDQAQLSDIKSVYAHGGSFAALKNDGTVVAWGNQSNGGDSSGVQDQLSDIEKIEVLYKSYIAFKSDGTVVTWGNASHGGDSSSVTDLLNPSCD